MLYLKNEWGREDRCVRACVHVFVGANVREVVFYLQCPENCVGGGKGVARVICDYDNYSSCSPDLHLLQCPPLLSPFFWFSTAKRELRLEIT